jgi:hypothetical protein
VHSSLILRRCFLLESNAIAQAVCNSLAKALWGPSQNKTRCHFLTANSDSGARAHEFIQSRLTDNANPIGLKFEVSLKVLLAWAFSLLTLSGAMIQSESVSECIESVTQAVQSISAEGASHHHADSDSSHTHHDSRDCHHNGTTCHSSHLGHCAFTIGCSVSVPAIGVVYFRSSSQVSANIFNLQANLFRPPIA